MQMPAVGASVGSREGQSESHFAVSESTPLRATASCWATSSWESWSQLGPNQIQVAVTKSEPTWACGPFQTSGKATPAEISKKC